MLSLLPWTLEPARLLLATTCGFWWCVTGLPPLLFMWCRPVDGDGEFEPRFISLIVLRNSLELALLIFYWADPEFFWSVSMDTLHVWMPCLRILGLGLTRGDAFTRILDGGDCKWTTLGAYICNRALFAFESEPRAPLVDVLRISRGR